MNRSWVYFFAVTALCCPASAYSNTGRQLADGLEQLTGVEIEPGPSTSLDELSDPAPPYITETGQVEIYGSGGYFIRYADWPTFQTAGVYEIVPLDLRYPSGHVYEGDYTQPWDIRKFRVVGSRGRASHEILVGGDMSPTEGRPVAIWPDDNIDRRIFVYNPSPEATAPDGEKWTRIAQPLFGQIGIDWLGHSYGGNFFQLGMSQPNILRHGVFHDPTTYLFYERVSDKGTTDPTDVGTPYVTQLFMRAMNHLKANGKAGVTDPRDAGPEIPVLSVGNPPYPSTLRTVGGYLMEGPRPLEIEVAGKHFIIVGFSCGDFPTDSYTSNYAWSTSPTGPYHPELTADGTDLLDLGHDLKARYGLSWLGRPSFFRAPNGEYGMLFHAVTKSVIADNDYTAWPTNHALWEFFRSLFKARVKIDISPITHGPRIRLDVAGLPPVPVDLR